MYMCICKINMVQDEFKGWCLHFTSMTPDLSSKRWKNFELNLKP